MKNIAIIPARGGSKRIPRKNIKEFHGRPIISYSIEACIESGLFDHVIVSTDDMEIAEISQKYGAEIPFIRPQELADDHSTIGDVVTHCINWMNEQDWDVSGICMITPTSPLVHVPDIIAAFNIFKTMKWNFVITATEFVSPIQRSFKLKKNNGIEMFFPEHFNTRSQDLDTAYHDAGLFTWAKPSAFLERVLPFSENSTVYRIPHYRVADLDTPEDWLRAELLYEVIRIRNSDVFK